MSKTAIDKPVNTWWTSWWKWNAASPVLGVCSKVVLQDTPLLKVLSSPLAQYCPDHVSQAVLPLLRDLASPAMLAASIPASVHTQTDKYCFQLYWNNTIDFTIAGISSFWLTSLPIAAFTEEFLYREIFQKRVLLGIAKLIPGSKKTLLENSVTRVALTALVFAAGHSDFWENPYKASVHLSNGVLFGVIAEKGGLFPATLAHAMHNIAGAPGFDIFRYLSG